MTHERTRTEAPTLTVAANGRRLIREDGSPFFWQGDSGWALFSRLDLTESDVYLRDRQVKGFNVIQAFYAAKWLPRNRYGEPPILKGDTSTPNPTFLDHVDRVIGLAEDRGIYICLGIGQIARADSPWHTKDISVAYTHARQIAERLRHRSNVIWNLGQDHEAIGYGTDLRPIVRSFAHGVADGINGRSTSADDADYSSTLMTYHAATSSGKWFHDDRWLDFNMIQTHMCVARIIDTIAVDFNMTPHKPVVLAEGAYEDGDYGKGAHWVTAHMVRKQAYWAVFSGAMGHTYGASGVYQFHREGEPSLSVVTAETLPWELGVDLDGAGQMRHLRNLIESRPTVDHNPDPLLATPVDSVGALDRIQATLAADGSHAFVYIPTGVPVSIDLARMVSDTVVMAWFDPRSGETIRSEAGTEGHRLVLIPPSRGIDRDWVLTIDVVNEPTDDARERRSAHE